MAPSSNRTLAMETFSTSMSWANVAIMARISRHSPISHRAKSMMWMPCTTVQPPTAAFQVERQRTAKYGSPRYQVVSTLATSNRPMASFWISSLRWRPPEPKRHWKTLLV